MEEILREFERKLAQCRVRSGTTKTHMSRVSTYLNWCREHGEKPLEQGSLDQFLKSREDKRLMNNTIRDYTYSLTTFLKVMT
ncbi:MAG TPA: hypothetical protein DCZ05_07370 [Deltaproteobacteria bacterium]|nr:hypothetical protein [Deltaproteobacteria bacterium]